MKKSKIPQTMVKNPEPSLNSDDWIIWAAWADRITFEEIFEKTGKKENDVIKIMRKTLSPNSFKNWRKRVNQKSIKHRKLFRKKREKESRKNNLFFIQD
tara:strand:+ start:179 stop:475 length:297 start_codon:yes stop_codon:yes gene_type:complete